jgi:hypothetical protein
MPPVVTSYHLGSFQKWPRDVALRDYVIDYTQDPCLCSTPTVIVICDHASDLFSAAKLQYYHYKSLIRASRLHPKTKKAWLVFSRSLLLFMSLRPRRWNRQGVSETLTNKHNTLGHSPKKKQKKSFRPRRKVEISVLFTLYLRKVRKMRMHNVVFLPLVRTFHAPGY